MKSLYLPADLAAIIIAAAARDFPKECCGLIEGTRSEDGWHARAVHETANTAPDPARRFLVDPAAQFALLRALRGTGRHIVGCFHSHPDGPAAPSDADRADAGEDGFLWVIAGGAPSRGFVLGAYRFDGDARHFEPVPVKT